MRGGRKYLGTSFAWTRIVNNRGFYHKKCSLVALPARVSGCVETTFVVRYYVSGKKAQLKLKMSTVAMFDEVGRG